MYVDFHIHTRYSDGGKYPEEILDMCKKENISYISITDHNTFKVYNDLNDNDIKILKGMEIDTKFNNKIVLHMLLYNFDTNSKLLKEYHRKNRRYEIREFNKLVKECEKTNNIKIDKKIKSNFIRKNNYFDKTRLNDLLVICGFCESPVDAFYKYTKNIQDGKRYKIPLKELFELEKDTKGIISLAHPMRYNLSLSEIKECIIYLKNNYNLRVVEAINNRETAEEEKELISFCKKNNLYISAGSDSHYKFGSKHDKTIGIINGRKIEEKEVTFLKL